MADLSKLRFNGTDYNVKDASAPLRKFTNYSKTGNLPITSDDTTQTAIGKLEKALDGKINTSAKGTANGVAELDANGKVPSSQLPSYVDDVLEYSAKSSFPATGETGKIYVDTTTNKTYRWSGSAYVEISESLALGETSSTAYRGDRGKTAYDHSQTSGNPHGTTGAGVNLTGYSKGSSTAAVAATDTVNAAIAKHENRIDANKTNILYNLNMGVKNLLNVPNGSYTTVSSSNPTTFSVNNGEMKVTTCTTGETRQVEVASITLEAGDYVLADRIFGSSAGDIRLMDNGSSITTDNPATFTLTTTKTLTVRLYTYHTSALNTTIKPMLCTAAAYAQSTAYQPYALPNTLITPELIELCDSWAKNLLPNGEASQSDTVWIDYPVSLQAGTYQVYLGTYSSTDTDDTRAQLYFLNGSTLLNDQCLITKTATGMNATITTTGTCDKLRVYASDNTSHSSGDTVTISKVMICTQAAWNVSHKYVPYRPNWDLVGKDVMLSNQAIGGNLTIFNFDISEYKGTSSNRYRYGLLVGGVDANNVCLYHVFIDASNNVTLTPAIPIATLTLTATISGTTLTITTNSTMYGGLRLLWLD